MREPWQPGRPVLTVEDVADWQAWRKFNILDAQRARRAKERRIDYYPTPEAATIIDDESRAAPSPPESTYRATISRIVIEWAVFRNKLGQSRS